MDCYSQASELSERSETLKKLQDKKIAYNELSLKEKELVKQEKQREDIMMLLNSVEEIIGPQGMLIFKVAVQQYKQSFFLFQPESVVQEVQEGKRRVYQFCDDLILAFYKTYLDRPIRSSELQYFEEKRGILLNLFKFTHSTDKDQFLALIEDFCQRCEKLPPLRGLSSEKKEIMK